MRRSLSLNSIRDVLTTTFSRRALSTASGASVGAPSEALALPAKPVVEEEAVWKGTLLDAKELRDRGYKNFLQETLYTLHCNVKRPSDVLHVINVNEGSVGTWAEFVVLSDWTAVMA